MHIPHNLSTVSHCGLISPSQPFSWLDLCDTDTHGQQHVCLAMCPSETPHVIMGRMPASHKKVEQCFASRILLALCHADAIPAPQLPTGGNLWAPSSDLCIGIFTLLPRVNSANTMASISTFSILDSPTSLFGTPVTSCF